MSNEAFERTRGAGRGISALAGFGEAIRGVEVFAMTVGELIDELKALPSDYSVEVVEGVFRPGEAAASAYRLLRPHGVVVAAFEPLVLIGAYPRPGTRGGTTAGER
jgi:hypothetical protein